MRQPAHPPSDDTSSPRADRPRRTVSVARMLEIDAAAIKTFGIPRLLLMEHAGLALAHVATSMCPAPGRTILVCCGTGFNGGDGLAAARHLQTWGYPLRLLLTGWADQLREEPAVYARMLQRLGVGVMEVTSPSAVAQVEPWMTECALIIDALLGIGIRGVVREPSASLIERINRSGRPVLAADIPSGLDGDVGLPQGVAVRATKTVAFGLAKQGCVSGEGPAYIGELLVEPIGIPPQLLESV